MTTHYIIESGHSGVAFGHYKTPGKRSPEVPPGVYEGEINRLIAEKVVRYLEHPYGGRHPAVHLTPGPMWPSLEDRVEYVNWLVGELEKDGHDARLVSIHTNAFGEGWNDTNFFRAFHAPKSSKTSAALARSITDKFDNHRFPYESRKVKTLKTPLLVKTDCPAVLVECGMMTNREAVKFLSLEGGRAALARAIVEGLTNCPK